MSLTASTDSSKSRGILLAALVVGVGLRLLFFLEDRSLWLDEALVSANVVERSWGQLMEPLDGEQAAPPIFLWAMKAATAVGGVHEAMLRLPALLASIGALLLLPRVARRLLDPAQVAWATTLWALLPAGVLFAAEAKPYGADPFFSILLIWLALRWREKPSLGRSLSLGWLGCVSLWASYPSAFVLGGIGLALLLDALRKNRKAIPALASCGLAWAASFAGLWWVIAGATASDSAFANYWQSSFLPLIPTSARDVGILVQGLFELVLAPFSGRYAHPSVDFGSFAAGLAAALAISGTVVQLRRQRTAAVILTLPLFLAAVASWLELYPFRGRFLLGLAPLVVLLLSAGMRQRVYGFTLLALAALPTSQLFVRPVAAPQTRQALEHLAQEMKPGDQLLIHSHSLAAVLFYERHFPACALPDHQRLISASPAEGIGGGYRAGAGLESDRDSWFLFETEWELTHPMGYVGAGLESRDQAGEWVAFQGSQLLHFTSGD